MQEGGDRLRPRTEQMSGALIVVLAALGALLLVLVNKAHGGTVAEKETTDKYPYQSAVINSGAIYSVDPDLIAAVISWEQRSDTKWDPNATNPNDPSYGLGQVTPYIAIQLGIIKGEGDYLALYDPQTNINAVAAFLSYLLNDKQYVLSDAIQMYNEGETNFFDGYRVPEYLNGVMGYYDKFRAVL